MGRVRVLGGPVNGHGVQSLVRRRDDWAASARTPGGPHTLNAASPALRQASVVLNEAAVGIEIPVVSCSPWARASASAQVRHRRAELARRQLNSTSRGVHN